MTDWKLAKASWPRPGSPDCAICNKLVDGAFYWDQDLIAHKDCVDDNVQPGNNRDDNLTWAILSDISANMALIASTLQTIRRVEEERNDMLREEIDRQKGNIL